MMNGLVEAYQLYNGDLTKFYSYFSEDNAENLLPIVKI